MEIKLKQPPITPRPAPPTLFQRFGPILLVIGVIGIMVMMFNLRTQNGGGAFSGMGLIFPLMMVFGAVMMFSNRSGQKKGETVKERTDYIRYLDHQRAVAMESAAAQFAVAQFHYPPPEELTLRIGSNRMWERRPGSSPGSSTFGHIRIGLGVAEAAMKYAPVEIGALEDQDPACVEAVNDFLDEHSYVRDIARPLALREAPAWAFVGDEEIARAAVRAALVHLAFFHGPDDMSIAVITDEAHGKQWDWVKWLPHHRFGRRRTPLTFESAAEFAEVMGDGWRDRGHFNERGRRAAGLAAAADGAPAEQVVASPADKYLVVLCDSATVDWDVLTVEGKGREGVTIVDMSGSCPLLQPRSTLVYEQGAVKRRDDAVIAMQANGADRGLEFLAVPDAMTIEAAEGFARQLSPRRPGTKASRVLSASGETAASIDLMKLLNIDDAANFDPEQTWKWGKDRRNFLRVPVGRYIDSGRTWYIDLKEDDQSHGPHIGLAGATGSGKSEFLRVLVMALCATHSPEDLVLIPCDFKGDKTFAGLERLPHVLFILNNLDSSRDRIARLRQVFQGEVLHREKLLRSVGEQAKNAEEYRRLRLRRPELNLEPMPALFIPFDELMQAKREAPELLTIMEIVGTVGRSLDIHMMPVSQEFSESLMSGIGTHIRGRIGLKMNQAQDYRAIIGSSNPGALPNRKGVGYFVGDPAGSAPAQRVESCYVSGPYTPPQAAATVEDVRAAKDYFKPVVLSALPDQAAVEIERGYAPEDLPLADVVDADEDLDEIDDADDADDAEDADGELDGAPTVMSTIIDVLDRTARQVAAGPDGHRMRPRQPWLPELVTYTPVTRFASRFVEENGLPGPLDLVSPCGMVDVPREHKQDVLKVGLRQNVGIVGRPDSGKSIALTSMILGAAALYSPERVQFYCLDNGGGALGQLRGLDHVGDVVTSGNTYGIERLLNHVQFVLKRRESEWSAAGVYDVDTWRRRRFGGEPGPAPDDGYGDVFFVVDGADSFCKEFPDHKQTLLSLADRGPKYGVHLVITARSWNSNGIHPFWDLITGLYELKLSDVGDTKMGRSCADAVPNLPGRGLISASGTGAARKDAIAASFTNLRSIPEDPAFHILFGEPVVENPRAQRLEGEQACEELNARYPGARPAERIPVLPATVSLAAVGHGGPGTVVLGQRESDLAAQVWRPAEDSHLVVLGEAKCGKTTALHTVGVQLQRMYEAAPADRKPVIVVFDLRTSLLGVVPDAARYVYNGQQVDEAVQYVQSLLAARSTDEVLTQEQLLARRQSGARFEGPEIYVLIDNYSDFLSGYADPFAGWDKAASRGAQVGFHLILSRVADQQAYSAASGVIAAVRNANSPVLFMSADPTLINVVGKTRGQKLPQGRGLYLSREERMMVQIAEPDA
ncbi:hypothetical protein EB74_30025 [Mycobacterium sp. SWH-M5]|nr:hypothetical protein EB74_30025 [Mycobacterium sp. SWH-M5]